MRVVVIRHGKVLYEWKKWCTSAEFDEQCTLYDRAQVDTASIYVVASDAKNIYISALDRTLQTAKRMFGDVDFKITSKLNEVPLRSGFDTSVRMPLWFWIAMGRIQWLTGNKRQPENRNQTAKRAGQFINMIINHNDDCTIVTHGFFMHTLIKKMKKAGFKADKNRVSYRNGEVIVLRKK
ncbi:MAG: histidine phosphatase family protein [Butyrivibrio sp.]|nr:histidine phosphatase family protein [Butyrivibrio sp.]